jgi:hypothetical protein
VETFSWRSCPSNHNLHQPQEPLVFYVCSGTESTSRLLQSIIILLQLYNHVSPWFPTTSIQYLVKTFISYTQGRRCSIWSTTFYSFEAWGILLEILHITTIVDSTFFKDIRIGLFLNGHIEVPDSQTPDLEILNPESPDFLNSSSWSHRSHEGERPQDDTNSRF